MSKRQLPPDRVSSYFRAESGVLAVITVTGLLYNIGLVAGPWFEGQMTEALARILLGEGSFSAMVSLAAGYIAVIAAVQGLRFLKRFYVRRFANKVNRRMKRVLYGTLVRSDRGDLERQGAGTVLTKAISDVDDCAEGMRKFTTEVFDTGVALAAYAGMLLWYDWRLALLSMVFLPVSYAIAERMKRPVQRTGAAFKEQAGALNAATMDRAVNALTYRVFGREEERRAAYEESLTAYERAAVKANLYTASLPPLYRVLSMIGAALILYFGGKNVLGTGWTVWSIAEFTTFLACFTKLATKSSKAAKLFNAVHKAQVQAFCAAKPCRRADSLRPEENEIRVPCPALAGQGIKAAACKSGLELFPRGTVRLSSSGVCLLLFPRSAAASQAFCAAKPCRRADSFRPEENEIRVPCPALAGQGIKAAACKPGSELLPRGTVSCRFLSRLPCCFSPAAQPRPKRFAQQNLAEGRIHSARVRSALMEPLPSGECPIKDF